MNWGLFRGFALPATEAQWTTPHCPDCTISVRGNLSPWVDWCNIGAIGYCDSCHGLFQVSSKWEQIPSTHIREERMRLVRHEVVRVEVGRLAFADTAKIWAWHQQLPKDALAEANALRAEFRDNSEEAVLLSYLLWMLIWNLDVSASRHLTEFFEFSLAHPQYVTYKHRPVWIGHQKNLADALEARYVDELPAALFQVWERRRPSVAEFKSGLGFYVSTSNKRLEQFGSGFAGVARQARMRPAAQFQRSTLKG